MAITNGYATAEQLKDILGISVSSTGDDVVLEAAVEAASRQIDDVCGRGRKFWQDSSTVTRTYYPSEAVRCYVDDISTTTGLVVKTDDNDDGTFETTLTINTDFIVEPVNAQADSSDILRPYESLRLIDGTLSTYSVLSSGRPFVQVTAKFGWQAVPKAVERACLLQAKNIYRSVSTYYGSFQLPDEGTPLRVPLLDPLAKHLVEGVRRWNEVDDGRG